MVDFFDDWNLNKWWKRKIGELFPIQKFGLKTGHCAICGMEDYIFPSGELHVCDKCYSRMHDNNAEINSHDIGINLNGEYCNVCGSRMYKYHIVSTYICNKCTRKIGKMAKEVRFKYEARKIA